MTPISAPRFGKVFVKPVPQKELRPEDGPQCQLGLEFTLTDKDEPLLPYKGYTTVDRPFRIFLSKDGQKAFLQSEDHSRPGEEKSGKLNPYRRPIEQPQLIPLFRHLLEDVPLIKWLAGGGHDEIAAKLYFRASADPLPTLEVVQNIKALAHWVFPGNSQKP